MVHYFIVIYNFTIFCKGNENSIDIPPEGLEFLDGLLELDPNKRISSENAIKHPFVVKYHDELDEPICEPFIDTIDTTKLKAKEWKRKFYIKYSNTLI